MTTILLFPVWASATLKIIGIFVFLILSIWALISAFGNKSECQMIIISEKDCLKELTKQYIRETGALRIMETMGRNIETEQFLTNYLKHINKECKQSTCINRNE